jgi:hypothetical protein
MRTRNRTVNFWRPFGALSFVAMLGIAVAFVALRAVAQDAPAPPPPSRAEESATIEDDAIIAPDSNESADSNLSFPTDI